MVTSATVKRLVAAGLLATALALAGLTGSDGGVSGARGGAAVAAGRAAPADAADTDHDGRLDSV